MLPITLNEKIRAFERVRASASSLIHDEIISEKEFRTIIDRGIKNFGNPLDNQKKIEEKLCTNNHNGEPSI